MVLLCPQRAPATTDPCRTPKLGAGPDSLNVIGNYWGIDGKPLTWPRMTDGGFWPVDAY